MPCSQRVLEFISRHAPTPTTSPIIYSVLFGNYDKPPNLKRHNGLECFLFTDRPELAAKPWRPVSVDASEFGAQRTARYFKCLGHLLFPWAELSVYFDASFALLKPIADLITDYQEADFAVFRHQQHKDVAAEAIACKRQRKDDGGVIDAQMRRYLRAGLSPSSPCYATGVLIRNLRSPLVAAVNEAWCSEIISGSVRDQLSLPFVLWRKGIEPDIIEGDVFYNKYLIPRPHSGTALRERVKRYASLQLFRLGLLRR